MKKIRDAQSLFGMLEGGELNREFTDLQSETLEELRQLSEDNPKATHKGEITLKLKLEVANGMVTISANMDAKTPRRPRRNSVYWVVEGGALSTEHPQQHDMFAGPRGVVGSDA